MQKEVEENMKERDKYVWLLFVVALWETVRLMSEIGEGMIDNWVERFEPLWLREKVSKEWEKQLNETEQKQHF